MNVESKWLIVWQGTGSINKRWNLSSYSPRVQAVLFGFSLICSRGWGLTAAAVTLDTVADESWKKMADCVLRSASRLCSRDGKICCYGAALSTIFFLACFSAFLPTFRFSFFVFLFSYFFSLHPGMFIFFVSRRLCSSHLPLSASTYFTVRVLSAYVICTLPHIGIL